MPVGDVDSDEEVDEIVEEDGDELHINMLLLFVSALNPSSAPLSIFPANWWYGDRVNACISTCRYCCSTFHSDPLPMCWRIEKEKDIKSINLSSMSISV